MIGSRLTPGKCSYLGYHCETFKLPAFMTVSCSKLAPEQAERRVEIMSAVGISQEKISASRGRVPAKVFKPRGSFLKAGRTIFEGAGLELLNNDKVREEYLGV